MNPPPNPHEQQARAAMREAIRPTLVNPPNNAPPPPDLAAALKHIRMIWPDMGHYLDDAQIGIGLVFDHKRGIAVQQMTIFIEVKGDNPK